VKELVLRQSPASNDVNTEAEEAAAFKLLPGDDFLTCCSELQSVGISASAIVASTYELCI
jgi:hypothetical protein